MNCRPLSVMIVCIIYELSAIVGYDSVRDSIAAYDVLPYKLLDLLCCDDG